MKGVLSAPGAALPIGKTRQTDFITNNNEIVRRIPVRSFFNIT